MIHYSYHGEGNKMLTVTTLSITVQYRTEQNSRITLRKEGNKRFKTL